jgi:hypothetical protein
MVEYSFPKTSQKIKTIADQKKYYLRKTKNTDLAKLKAALWTVFAFYIKLRDCLITSGTVLSGSCFTCDMKLPIKLFEAGHFLAGRGNAILFDERCVHIQCKNCNEFLHGNPEVYEKRMIQKYGQEVVDELKAMKGKAYRFTKDQLAFAIDDYKAKNDHLKKLVIPKNYVLKNIT